MIDQYNVIEYLKENNTPLNVSYVFSSRSDKGWKDIIDELT